MNHTIKCKICNADIPSSAEICPSCGVKVKKVLFKRKSFWIIAAIILVCVAYYSNNETNMTNKKFDTTSVENLTKDINSNSAKDTDDNSKKSSTNIQNEKNNYYKHGMYKVGTDLAAGEYVIVTNSSTYMQISKDSTGSFDSIVANDNFKNRSIVTVNDGQYLEFNSGNAYAIDNAPEVDKSSGKLKEGMYIVGKDLPAGEYKISSTGGDAYLEISSNSSHNFSSIISNDNFNGEKYISVSDGQYIKFNGCELILN